MRFARIIIAVLVALATFFSLNTLARNRRFGWGYGPAGYFGGRRHCYGGYGWRDSWNAGPAVTPPTTRPLPSAPTPYRLYAAP